MTGNRIRLALGVTVLGFVLSTGIAAADPALTGNGCSNACPTGSVLGEEVTVASPTAAPSLALTPDETPAGQLPFTGGDVAGMLVIGALALGAGTVLVRRSRTTAAK